MCCGTAKAKFCVSFRKKVGCHNNILTEILAISRACHLCISRPELKFKSTVIVSDSLMAVSWINSNGVGSWVHSHLIMEIRNLLGILRQAQVEFSPREYNVFTDLLAKKGADGEEDVLDWRLS